MTDLARAARALKARHGDLLRGEPSFIETTAQTNAASRLDAARERLRGERDGVRHGQASLFDREA